MSGYRDETLEAYASGAKKLHSDGAPPICEELLMWRRYFRALRDLRALESQALKAVDHDMMIDKMRSERRGG